MEFKKDKLRWLEFDLLKSYPEISHAVFTRQGGTSNKPYATLNLGNGVGDHPDCVKVNRELIGKHLGIHHVVFPHQLHSDQVAHITSKNLHATLQADALITSEKNIGIAALHADCQGVLFYDPICQAIAVAHVGWKGNVKNILEKTVEALHREFDCQSHNLIACISPSLGPDHAEYKNYDKEFPQDFWEYQSKPYYFNFWEISHMQLSKCGLLDKNIEIAKICTACCPEEYFSARREKLTGRNASVIALNA